MWVKMNRDSGVTMIELLVVISIIGILAVALGISYSGWRGNYRVESELKNVYADLIEARTRAITRNAMYFAVIDKDTYGIYEDTDNSGTYTGGDALIWPQKKKIQYGFKMAMISSDTMPVTVTFDTRGLMSLSTRGLAAQASFRIDSTGLTPDYDCIILSQARVRTGQFDGATCVEK